MFLSCCRDLLQRPYFSSVFLAVSIRFLACPNKRRVALSKASSQIAQCASRPFHFSRTVSLQEPRRGFQFDHDNFSSVSANFLSESTNKAFLCFTKYMRKAASMRLAGHGRGGPTKL